MEAKHKIETLPTPHAHTFKSGKIGFYPLKITYDCGHSVYSKAAPKFFEEDELEHKYCKRCLRGMERLQAMLDDADDFTDWSY